eukprot:15453503-Alexandrium_andersonii.AAC.1
MWFGGVDPFDQDLQAALSAEPLNAASNGVRKSVKAARQEAQDLAAPKAQGKGAVAQASVLKRPSGTEAAEPQLRLPKGDLKNRRSRAYHAAFTVAKKQGLDPAACKDAARAAFRAIKE